MSYIACFNKHTLEYMYSFANYGEQNKHMIGKDKPTDDEVWIEMDDVSVLSTHKVVLNDNSYVLQEDATKIKKIQDEKFSTLLNVIRNRRNQLLLESDWTQLPRSPLTDEQKDAWEAYRQALRDLPSTLTEEAILYPDTITWPVKPQ